MKNENTHPIVDLPVKTILSFGPVGEILKNTSPPCGTKAPRTPCPRK